MPRKAKAAVAEETKTEKPVEKVEKTTTKVKKSFISGTGRRKTAIARIFLWEEKGEFTINDIDSNDFFKNEMDQTKWLKPFHLVGVSHPKAKFSGSIKVKGSGTSAQVDAILHAVSRALAKFSDEYKLILAKAGMLTRDPRMVERKKPFLHKARKRPQYSKR